VIFACLVIAFLALWGRLFYWQITQKDILSAMAFSQYTSRLTLTAERGEIFFRDGHPMSINEPRYRVVADPTLIKENKLELSKNLARVYVESVIREKESAQKYFREASASVYAREANDSADATNLPLEIGKTTEMDEQLKYLEVEQKYQKNIEESLNRTDTRWVMLLPSVTMQTKEQLAGMEIQGLFFEELYGRYYPDGGLAGNISGFLASDEEGLAKGVYGVEGFYDAELQGARGRIWYTKDVRGNTLITSDNRRLEAKDGSDLYLSIDRAIQYRVSKLLEERIAAYGALRGDVVVMKPQTGEVLAMVSYPAFNPSYWAYDDSENFSSPIVSRAYEPGSTFKVLVMAAGLDAGVITPETRCPVCAGPRQVGSHFIRTWNNQYRDNPTMTEVLVNSDNTGMVYVGDLLGNDRLYDYVTKFGFGAKSGIDMQEDSAAALRSKNEMREIDYATMTFGQGIAVTPMQMVKAVAAIANGGIMPEPRVVKTIFRDGDRIEVRAEQRRVISEEAADTVTRMMIQSAAFGEAKFAYVKGFSIAGKTGTAQIAIDGRYDEKKTIASFIGFAPAYDPEFVMLVKIDEPTSSQWGSETAAPLWFAIAQDLFAYYGRVPEK
jgi:cell division protein FtsI/penicillin-binding protein 2